MNTVVFRNNMKTLTDITDWSTKIKNPITIYYFSSSNIFDKLFICCDLNIDFSLFELLEFIINFILFNLITFDYPVEFATCGIFSTPSSSELKCNNK